MPFMDWFWWVVSEILGGEQALKSLLSGSWTDRLKAIGHLVIWVFGASSVVRLLWKWVFRRKSRLAAQLEELEKRHGDVRRERDALREQKKQLEQRVKEETAKHPEAALAKAEKELRDRNQTLAIGHLEAWFDANAASIGAIAKRLARYHIQHAIPDPEPHLARADQMLRLARGALPGDQEAREIFNEFSAVNGALQEQILRAGDELSEAAQELRVVVAGFDPKTDPSECLLRSVHALLAMAEGGPHSYRQA